MKTTIFRKDIERLYKLLSIDGYKNVVRYLEQVHKELDVLHDLVRELNIENESLKLASECKKQSSN